MVNGGTKTEATRNHVQVLISKLLPQRAHFMWDVLFNPKERRYYLTAEYAEEISCSVLYNYIMVFL